MKELAKFVHKTFGNAPWYLTDLLEVAPVELLPLPTRYLAGKGASRQALAISLGKQFRSASIAYFVPAVIKGPRKLWTLVDHWHDEFEMLS